MVEKLVNDKKNLATLILFVMAAILLVLIIVKAAGNQFHAPRLASDTKLPDPNDPKYLKSAQEKTKKLADDLKAKNPFLAQPSKPSAPNFTSILDGTALSGGKWYKKGDNVSGAEILEIGPTFVKIKFEGREETKYPWVAQGPGGGPGPRGPMPPNMPEMPSRMPSRAMMMARPMPAAAPPPPAPAGEDRWAWLGVKLSDKARANLERQLSRVPEDKRAEAEADMKKEWETMSPEKKEKAIQQLENEN